MKPTYILILAMLLCQSAWSQIRVSGKILDAKTGTGIPGANILIKGVLTGTNSDNEGKFQLTTNQTPPFVIQVSFLGYQKTELEVRSSGEITVSL